MSKHTTPVLLDENDSLVAEVQPTPTDPAFRRALFVMLLVLGLFAAATYLDGRDSKQDARDARNEAREAREQTDTLIAGQEKARRQAAENEAKAEAERQALAGRSRALEQLVIALLANEDDPEVRATFEEFAREQGITLIPEPGGTPPRQGGNSSSGQAGPQGGGPAPSEGGGDPEPDPEPPADEEPEPAPSPPPVVPLPGGPACVEVDVLGITQEICTP